jgi:hypothetical protein
MHMPEHKPAKTPEPKHDRIKHDIPFDEGMRVEHAERIVRPKPNEHADPDDPADQGPHVERVGMPQPDTDPE